MGWRRPKASPGDHDCDGHGGRTTPESRRGTEPIHQEPRQPGPKRTASTEGEAAVEGLPLPVMVLAKKALDVLDRDCMQRTVRCCMKQLGEQQDEDNIRQLRDQYPSNHGERKRADRNLANREIAR